MNWARKVQTKTGSEKSVLLALADFHNEQEQCAWPGRTTLKEITCLSLSTISRATKSLEAQGLIVIQKWFDEADQEWANNRYYFPHIDPTASAVAKQEPIVRCHPYGNTRGKTNYVRL